MTTEQVISGCVFAALSLAAAHGAMHAPTGEMEAWFLDVGQGDATLLQSPSGRRILVDGGPDASVLRGLALHMPLLDRSLDVVVLTHADSDHANGILPVLRQYRVKAVMLPRVPHETEVFRSILQEIRTQRIPVIFPDPALDIRFDDGLTLNVLWPRAGTPPSDADTNGQAVVVLASAGEKSLLLTADIEAASEAAILQNSEDIAADALKVAHHGSKTSSGTGFLLAASPTRAFISAGRTNSFGHPHPSVLGRLRNMGIKTWVTGWEGEGRY